MHAVISRAVGGEKGKRIISRDVMCWERLMKLGVVNESSEEEEMEDELILQMEQSLRQMESRGFRRTLQRATNYHQFSIKHGYISVFNNRKKMVSDQSLLEYVKFMYQSCHGQFLAHRSKRVRISDDVVMNILKVR